MRYIARQADIEVTYICDEDDRYQTVTARVPVVGSNLRQQGIRAEGGGGQYGATIVVSVPICPACGGSHDVEF